MVTVVLAPSLVREPKFGRENAELTTNAQFFFLSTSKFYSLYKAFAHALMSTNSSNSYVGEIAQLITTRNAVVCVCECVCGGGVSLFHL